MEKLIELLEEFNKEMWWHPWLLYEWFWVRKWDLNFIFNHSEFPFIKWLEYHDKIDYKKLDKIKSWGTLNVTNINNEMYEDLIMLLAIQDEPIEFLISILK